MGKEIFLVYKKSETDDNSICKISFKEKDIEDYFFEHTDNEYYGLGTYDTLFGNDILEVKMFYLRNSVKTLYFTYGVRDKELGFFMLSCDNINSEGLITNLDIEMLCDNNEIDEIMEYFKGDNPPGFIYIQEFDGNINVVKTEKYEIKKDTIVNVSNKTCVML